MSAPFWDKKWGKDAICPITYTRLRPGTNKYGNTYTVELQCGHRFCRSAITNWIITSFDQSLVQPKCPVCRCDIHKI